MNGTIRDNLTEDYHRSALKTGMQCLTGAAGGNNVPADFCLRQLNKQRSINWAVLPDKPSVVDGSVRPFAVIITIRGAASSFSRLHELFIELNVSFRHVESNGLRFVQSLLFQSERVFRSVHQNSRTYTSATCLVLVAWLRILRCSTRTACWLLFIVDRFLSHRAVHPLLNFRQLLHRHLRTFNDHLCHRYVRFFFVDRSIDQSSFPAVGVAIFAALEWELGIVEAIIVIMSVGLSVDFVVHFGVGYIHANVDQLEQGPVDETSNLTFDSRRKETNPCFRTTPLLGLLQTRSFGTQSTCDRIRLSRWFSCVHGCIHDIRCRILNDSINVEFISTDGSISHDNQYVSFSAD